MADTRAAGDLADQGVAGGYMVETLGGVGGTRVTENGVRLDSLRGCLRFRGMTGASLFSIRFFKPERWMGFRSRRKEPNLFRTVGPSLEIDGIWWNVWPR